MAVIRVGGVSIDVPEPPQIPRYLVDAMGQQARLIKAAGVDRLLQQIADDERLPRDAYGAAWDGIASAVRRDQALFDAVGKQVAAMESVVIAAGVSREIFDREIGPMLRTADAYATAVGPTFGSSVIEAARAAFSPAAIGISQAAERVAREALSGIVTGVSEEMQRALSSEWLAISSNLAEYGSRWLEGLHLPSEEEMEEGRREQVATAFALAEHGWTIPLTFSPRQVDEAIAVGRDKGLSALDEDMVALYSDEDSREFDTLAATLRHRYTAKKRRQWYPFLIECLSCYRAGHYRAAALIAIPLLERGVADVIGIENMGGRHPTLKHHTWNRWKAEQDAKAPTRNFFLDSLSCSVGRFIACTWQDSTFIGPRPKQPNRHRGVHGRDPEFGSQADALRLLIALDTLGYVTTEMRREDYARRRGRRHGH